jgi:hypothetical protein
MQIRRLFKRCIIWVMDGHDQLITIRQFGDMSEALLAKGCLESAGIPCFLADANITRMEWPISRGMRLQVNEEDAEAASTVLEQLASEASRG